MKRNIFIMFLLTVVSVTAWAQTTDHGGGLVSVRNGNHYKLTRNVKSNNGGSVSMTFSGLLKNGKRDGVWKLTSTYNNYGGGNGYFFTGTSTMTRSYSNGVLNGIYTLTQNIKRREGSYNRFRGGWTYGPFKDASEHVSGSFRNGKPTGKWSVSAPMLACIFELSDGTPVGNVSVTKTAMGGGIKMAFRDGYLVKWEPITNKSGVEGLQWNIDEDLANLPDQEKGDLLNELNFLGEYMGGSDFSDWIKNYPKESSEENFTIPYKLADRNNHYVIFGNPSGLERQLIEIAQSGRKQAAKEQISYDKASEIRKRVEEISNPLIAKWEKENPTYKVNVWYWRLQAYKKATTLDELKAVGYPGLNHLRTELDHFQKEEQVTREYRDDMNKIISILKQYDYDEREILSYIHANLRYGGSDVDYGPAKQRYESRLVRKRKAEFARLADESPLTLDDFEFYYKWNEFNKKNIVELDSLRTWRKAVFVNGMAYTHVPVEIDYDKFLKEFVRTEYKESFRFEKPYIKTVILFYFTPKNKFEAIKVEQPIHLLGYLKEKTFAVDWEKAKKNVIKKYPQFKESKKKKQ